MTIFLEKLGLTKIGKPFTWNQDDTLLYAVSLGAGMNSCSDLTFTTENTVGQKHQVLPTFAVIMAMRSNSNPFREVGDFPFSSVIHAGQKVSVTSPIPSSGRAIGTSKISAINDVGKHALIETTTLLHDPETNVQLAKTVSTVLLLGEGGFGGESPIKSFSNAPQREPDGIIKTNTAPNQALLYRLNGDRNPLHSDPIQAQKAGFPSPILHGLCTFGISARVLLTDVLENQVERFASVEAKFRAPVFPGSALETNWWRESDRIYFQTVSSNTAVIDEGIMLVNRVDPSASGW